MPINVTQTYSELEKELNLAETPIGNFIPKPIKVFMLNIKAENPELEIHFAGSRTMDFFKSPKADKFCFLSPEARYFCFQENPAERSRTFFAYEQELNIITLYTNSR